MVDTLQYSLGYAGLCECVQYMTGVPHTEEPGTSFGLKVMQYLNDAAPMEKEKQHGFLFIWNTNGINNL